MIQSRAKEILTAFSGKRIAVIGDVMLDEYIWGTVNRISPEAPVMIVDAERYTQVPGGAANVVNNICALGGVGIMLGVIGDDDAGRMLSAALDAEGAETTGLIVLPERPTSRKTRIIAHSQQVVRVDHERRAGIPADAAQRLCDTLELVIAKADAVLLSDYQKGVLIPDVLREAVRISKHFGKPIAGNLKPKIINRDCALTVLTLNLAEASQALGAGPLDSSEAVDGAGEALLQRSGAEHVIITRGADGLTLFSAASPDKPFHVAAHPVAVYDVAGAGDTTISTLTLALAAGASAKEAVTLANYAAAEAVKKVGVATVTCAEILAAVNLG